MWKNLLRAVLFVSLFSLIFSLISPIFIPKNNSPEAGIHEHEAKGFLAEPENSLDVVFLGDSETFSAFIPLRIWEQYGMTSYVCSTANQVMYQSRSYLERVLETQNPRVVILETNALYRDYTLADVVAHEVQERLPFLRYHDRWKTLSLEDFGEGVDFRTIQRDKGYAYRSRAIAADLTGYMAPSEEVHPVPALNQAYFREILTLCQDRGIRLVLISTPSPVNWSSYYHNGVARLAQEWEVPYLDMNLLPEEIPINWNTDSYDGGDHLNYAGACKATDYTASWLWDTGLFTDKRENPDYSAWNDHLQDFLNFLESEPNG